MNIQPNPVAPVAPVDLWWSDWTTTVATTDHTDYEQLSKTTRTDHAQRWCALTEEEWLYVGQQAPTLTQNATARLLHALAKTLPQSPDVPKVCARVMEMVLAAQPAATHATSWSVVWTALQRTGTWGSPQDTTLLDQMWPHLAHRHNQHSLVDVAIAHNRTEWAAAVLAGTTASPEQWLAWLKKAATAPSRTLVNALMPKIAQHPDLIHELLVHATNNSTQGIGKIILRFYGFSERTPELLPLAAQRTILTKEFWDQATEWCLVHHPKRTTTPEVVAPLLASCPIPMDARPLTQGMVSLTNDIRTSVLEKIVPNTPSSVCAAAWIQAVATSTVAPVHLNAGLGLLSHHLEPADLRACWNNTPEDMREMLRSHLPVARWEIQQATAPGTATRAHRM